MYAADREALLCDMAETYHVLEPRALPVPTLAALACGLSPDSRIKRKLSGASVPTALLLLAAAVDRLSLLVWMQTKDGARNRNRPRSLLEQMVKPENTESIAAYNTPEAFMAARAKIVGG